MRLIANRSIAALALLCGLVLPARGAAQHAKGQRYLGAHVGVSGVGSAIALGLNGELAYDDRIGIGVVADTWRYGATYGTPLGAASWNVRYVALAATGAWHFPVETNPRIDPFAGLSLGYFIVHTTAEDAFGAGFIGESSRTFMGAFGGVRYFFRESLTGVARLGFGSSYLTLGVDLRL